jgi:hypothetical protein
MNLVIETSFGDEDYALGMAGCLTAGRKQMTRLAGIDLLLYWLLRLPLTAGQVGLMTCRRPAALACRQHCDQGAAVGVRRQAAHSAAAQDQVAGATDARPGCGSLSG